MPMSGAGLNGAVIRRKRGDTAPDKFIILDEESTQVPKPPLNITGFSYKLTVNTERDPDPGAVPPIGTELYSLVGVLTDPVNGTMEAAPTAIQANQLPDVYWYDVQQTDGAGKIKTIAKNKYIFDQDITKV